MADEMSLEQKRAVALATARLRLQQKKQEVPAFEKEAREIIETTPAELISAHPLVRMATGAARPILGAAALLERPFGLTGTQDRIKQLDEMQARGAKALGFGGLETGTQDLAGAILSPVTAVAAKTPLAASYLGKVGQAAGIGGVAGLTAGTADPLASGATGAFVAGAIPAVGIPALNVGKAGYHALVEPTMAPAVIKGRAFLEAAGDKADEIIGLLRQNREIVPGSRPTAAEAVAPAGSAEFSALQESARRFAPSKYVARADEQNAARLAALRTVGKDKAALGAAEATRAETARRTYGAVAADVVPEDKISQALFERPAMQKALARAQQLTSDQGGTWGGTVRDMQNVKMALDDMTMNPERYGIGASEARAVERSRAELVAWLNTKSPGWAQARATYAEQSAPINQMQIGQYLEGKLVPALSEEAKQRSGIYAQALRDAPGTIKRATGAPRFDELTKALTPEQLAAVNSVRDDLARSARTSQLAQAGQGSASAGDMATASMERAVGGKVPNPLNRHVMVFNQILNRLEGKINKKLAAEIAVEMLEPKKVGETITQALARQKRNEWLASQVQKYTLPAYAVGVQEGQ